MSLLPASAPPNACVCREKARMRGLATSRNGAADHPAPRPARWENRLKSGPRSSSAVDGGATRCRARLRDAAGAFLAEVEGPAANIYVDFDGALARADRNHLRQGGTGRDGPCAARPWARPRRAFERGRCEARRGALRGTGWRARRQRRGDGLPDAHGGADGALIIAGTGSAAIARVRGRETVIGGRGFLLGDDGSAARVGADAVRAAFARTTASARIRR